MRTVAAAVQIPHPQGARYPRATGHAPAPALPTPHLFTPAFLSQAGPTGRSWAEGGGWLPAARRNEKAARPASDHRPASARLRTRRGRQRLRAAREPCTDSDRGSRSCPRAAGRSESLPARPRALRAAAPRSGRGALCGRGAGAARGPWLLLCARGVRARAAPRACAHHVLARLPECAGARARLRHASERVCALE